jgi:hypothetical protein
MVSKTTATLIPGQTCMQTQTFNGDTFVYTWTGVSFTLSTSDGLNGTVTGHVNGPFTETSVSPPANGTCDGTFTGVLTNTGP